MLVVKVVELEVEEPASDDEIRSIPDMPYDVEPFVQVGLSLNGQERGKAAVGSTSESRRRQTGPLKQLFPSDALITLDPADASKSVNADMRMGCGRHRYKQIRTSSRENKVYQRYHRTWTHHSVTAGQAISLRSRIASASACPTGPPT